MTNTNQYNQHNNQPVPNNHIGGPETLQVNNSLGNNDTVTIQFIQNLQTESINKALFKINPCNCI